MNHKLLHWASLCRGTHSHNGLFGCVVLLNILCSYTVHYTFLQWTIYKMYEMTVELIFRIGSEYTIFSCLK